MRYLVIGTSGAGKSSFAARLAAVAQCPHIELDALHWGANWQAVPGAQFRQSVIEATRAERWVADGNYSAVREQLWPQATHVVWLDYDRFTVFSRVLWRTLSRGLLRTRLFHGNRESLRTAFFSRDSILLWSFTSYARNRRAFAALRQQPAFAHLQWTQLHEPAQADALLQALARAPCPGGKAGA